MEFLFELIFELLFEGTIEMLPNKKIPKWIRFPLGIIVLLIIVAGIGICYLCGFLALKENMLFAIICFVLATILTFSFVMKFKDMMKKLK